MATIKKLTILGYKSIKELKDFQLSPRLNILIGANGAGKSNFISYFRFLNAIINERMQLTTNKLGGADKIFYNGIKNTKHFSSQVYFADNGYFFDLTPGDSGRLLFEKEQIYFDGPNYGVSKSKIGSGNEETKLTSFKGQGWEHKAVYSFITPALKSWIIYHFHDTSDTASVKQFCEINNNIVLESDAGNLAAFLYRLRSEKPVHYKSILKATQRIAPFLKDFILRPNPLRKSTIQFEWQGKESDQPFTASQLSDGTIRFICLATVLLQPEPPKTIIIDEPELGLHPYALSVLGSLLRSTSSRCQIILSTQSVQLVNEFEPEDIVVVDRENGQSTFKKLSDQNLKEWLDNYSMGELWEKNVFGGRPTE